MLFMPLFSDVSCKLSVLSVFAAELVLNQCRLSTSCPTCQSFFIW
uniref:Uncharacterized protein n=1 Tax=Anguilla anguilla TaxID=7936 RepID=A0A0E9QM67_ANGAN